MQAASTVQYHAAHKAALDYVTHNAIHENN
jgi:hypothetical protein